VQQSIPPNGIVFIERQPKGTSARRAKGQDCGTLLYWTEKCLEKQWRLLHRSLDGDGMDAAMRALLGEKPDMKKIKFIDSTLERLSGDLVAQFAKRGRREYALHIRKLVFAVSYLGKLCRFASDGDADGYSKFVAEKIIGLDGKPRSAAADMLLKDRNFLIATGFAEAIVEEKAASPFPKHDKPEGKTPLVENARSKPHLELPDGMRELQDARHATALAECRGMVAWKLAQFVLELRQAASYSLENAGGNGNGNGGGNGKGTASHLAIDAIDGSGLTAMLAQAEMWKKISAPMNLENAAKFGGFTGNCAEGAQKLAEGLHRISEGKLARKITYLSHALSLLESGDIAGAKLFWEETLPSKVKERVDGVETGLAAKSLLEDGKLSLAFSRISGAHDYAPAVTV